MRRTRVICGVAAAGLVGAILSPGPVAAGGGCHAEPTGMISQARGEGAEPIAHIAECVFEPSVLYVEPRAAVTWVNKDAMPHTVTGVRLSWGNESFLSRGDELTATFPKSGVFPYYCVVHPGMVGVVVVGDPDPADVAVELSSMTSGGKDVVTEVPQGDTEAAKAVDARSDSIPGAALWTALALLVAAAVMLRWRFGRAEGPIHSS